MADGRYIDIVPAIEIDIDYSEFISSINEKPNVKLGSTHQLLWHEVAHFTSLTTTTYGLALTTAANIRFEYFLLILKQIEKEKQFSRFEADPLMKSFSKTDKSHLSSELQYYIRSYLEINDKYSRLISETPVNKSTTLHDEIRCMKIFAESLPNDDSKIEKIRLNFEIEDLNKRIERAINESEYKETLHNYLNRGNRKKCSTTEKLFIVDPYDIIQTYREFQRSSDYSISPKSVLEGYARWADTSTLCKYEFKNATWEQKLIDLFLNNSAKNQKQYSLYGVDYGDVVRHIFSVLGESYSKTNIVKLIPYLLELSFCYYDDRFTSPANLKNFRTTQPIDTESFLSISDKLQLLVTSLLDSSKKIVQILNCLNKSQNEVRLLDLLTDLNNWRIYSKTQLSPLLLSSILQSEHSIRINNQNGFFSITGKNHELENWKSSFRFISTITLTLLAYKIHLFKRKEFFEWFNILNFMWIIKNYNIIPLIVICSNKCYYKDEWFKDRKEKKHILGMIVKDQVHKDLIESAKINKSRKLFKSIFGQDASFNIFLKNEFPCYDLIKKKIPAD